ncbi:YebC/PmpR family DNA-binding transcriptional regulator [Chloroflexota bacterium]
MSGHSKWSSIKHQKGVTDARRGQLFTKLAREIIVAVRQSGSNPDTNFRLRLTIQRARDNNMPHDNIERAIKRGSGATEGEALAEITLEGYGPGGTAILVQALSDNRNRTIQDIRNIFSRHGGNLGENGCVAWIFNSKGLIIIETNDLDADELSLYAIDAGADDVQVKSNYVEIYTQPEDLEKVREALEQKELNIASAELSMVSKTTVSLEDKIAVQTLKLLDKLEELVEVQHIASNADFADSVLQEYKSRA